MGAAERVSRRTIQAAAKEAVEKTNDIVGRYNQCVRALDEVRTSVDLLQGALKDTRDEQSGRFDAQGTWIAKLDTTIDALTSRLEEHNEMLSNDALTIIEIERIANAGFWGRLRWLVLGR